MAQSGYSPISLYYSTTASATPSAGNLVSGELAINITDGILFYKDNAGVVQTLATKAATSGTFTSITLSGGTANGVAYLNGSKVVTTGSALTFDGTSLSVGTSSHPSTLAVYAATGGSTTGFTVNASGNMLNLFGSSSTNAGVIFDATDGTVGSATGVPMIWRLGGSEGMRLTSTGLGIGTSSPSYKLHVNGYVYSGSGFVLLSQAYGGGSIYEASGNTGIAIGDAANVMRFSTSGTERMRLDSSGNLGIGTSSPAAKLDIAAANPANQLGGQFAVTSTTAYATGNVAGISFRANDSSAAPSSYASIQMKTTGDNAGALTFVTRSSAGAWDERMRLDSSGNLGLGVTPSAWGSNWRAINFGYSSGIGQLAATSAGSGEVALVSAAYNNNTNWLYFYTGAAASKYSQSSGAHAWYTAASGTAGNAISFTQAMTLDASGNLGLGATSPLTKMHVQVSSLSGYTSVANSGLLIERGNGPAALNIASPNTESGFIWFADQDSESVGNIAYNHPSNFMSFQTNGSERARITSGGDLLVGTTSAVSANGRVVILGAGSSSNALVVRNNSDTIVYETTQSSGTSYYGYFLYNGTTVGSITSTGSSTLYNTSSDYRLKDNQQPLTGSGAFIDALQPKTWNWKADGSRGVGFIAHEVQEVSPGSVVGEKDGERMQAMEYGSAEFIANIIAELQSLRKRVAQLEGK